MTCGQMLKFSFHKLLFEMVGTMIFTVLFIGNDNAAILAGLWILTIFCWKISGSHFNPAITFAYMLRRDKSRMSFALGIAYFGAQFVGALLGSFIMLYFEFSGNAVFVIDGKKWFIVML